jgi:hypothetical protein
VSSKGKRIKSDPDKSLRSEDDRRNINSALGGKMEKGSNRMYIHGYREEEE